MTWQSLPKEGESGYGQQMEVNAENLYPLESLITPINQETIDVAQVDNPSEKLNKQLTPIVRVVISNQPAI
jgi:hypothetical protein